MVVLGWVDVEETIVDLVQSVEVGLFSSLSATAAVLVWCPYKLIFCSPVSPILQPISELFPVL